MLADQIEQALQRERARANSVAATVRLAAGAFFLVLSVALWQIAGLWDWGVYVPLLSAYTALAVLAYVFRSHLVPFTWLMSIADVAVVYFLQRQALPISPFPAGVAGFSLGLFAWLVSLASLTLSSSVSFAVAGTSAIAQVALMHQAGVSRGPMIAAVAVLFLVAGIGHTSLRRLRVVSADLAQAEAARQIEHRRFQEVEHANQTIERILREAHETNDRLERLQRDKETVLQTLVHDMRNPLTDIIIALDGIEETAQRERNTPALRQTLDEVKVAAKRVAGMVTEMLDLATLEEGRLVLDRSPIRLAHLVEATRRQRELLAAERAVSIDVEGDAAAEVDARLMTRVLENLIANAIRHSPRCDRVLVALGADRGGHVISVHNNGARIPLEVRDRIFEKFVRGDRDGGCRDGWGLGLFFCRMVVDAHGGTIAVEDMPGWSTSLVIRLPDPRLAQRPVGDSQTSDARVPVT